MRYHKSISNFNLLDQFDGRKIGTKKEWNPEQNYFSMALRKCDETERLNSQYTHLESLYQIHIAPYLNLLAKFVDDLWDEYIQNIRKIYQKIAFVRL